MNLYFYTTIQRLENILKSIIKNATNVTYLTGIQTPKHRFCKQKIMDMFVWLYATFGCITAMQLDSNMRNLTKLVPPNQPIAMIFRQIRLC